MIWRKTTIFLIFVGIVCCEDWDGKNRQTFVVRYKSGDQTIPVTVVLDHRKQTEYVINMSPRTTAKSVTLYDFKQRTIAYKDLTNRECFLGRLTHETLSEESDALNRVQNPVDHKPKVLSLDPQSTSLTPTEIRNMAGQKTAVFCRKMNTWLILPQESHSIHKRDVDDEEVDERTFHRHGYHTVRYSHYGRETRRRYRTSNHNATRQQLHRNKGASSIPKIAYSESEAGDPPTIEPPDVSFDTYPRSESRELDHGSPFIHSHSQIPKHPKEEIIPSASATLHSNSFQEYNPSHNPNADSNNEHGTISSYPSFQSRESHPVSSEIDIFDPNPNVLNSLLENPLTTENTPFEIKGNFSVGNPTFQNENITETKLYPEPSIYNQDNHEHRLHSPGQHDRNLEYYSPGKSDGRPNLHNQIETEAFSNELLQHATPIKYPKIEHDVPEHQDLSSNTIETPKASRKFENLESRDGHGIVPQTNEDLHDVFEGFYNLRRGYPPSDHNTLHNSYFIPPATNKVGEHSFPEESSIINPIYPRGNFRHVNGSDWQRKDNTYPTELHGFRSTDSPALNTVDNDYNRIADVYPTDTYTTLPETQNRGSTTENTVHQHFAIYENQRRNLPLKSGDAVYDENVENPTPTTTFPPLPPFQVHSRFGPSRHRSDIPSESDHDEVVQSYTPQTNDNWHIHSNNQQVSSVVPTTIVKEGSSLHEQRFHNILRQYKPDQIVIDIENIPTQLPPDSNSEFQRRPFASTEKPHIPRTTIISNEQTSREERRSNYSQSTWNPRRNSHFPNAANAPRRNNVLLRPPNRNKPNTYPRLPPRHVNNLHHSIRPHFPSDFNSPPRHFDQLHPPLDSLPPGVSIHPRHPKAPYADMFHPNVLQPSLPQGNHFRTLKPHRQRHHRKKDRFQQRNSCCGGASKGDCCSGHRGEGRSKSSCCSGRNGKNTQLRVHNIQSNGISNALHSRQAKGRFGVQQPNRRFNTLPPVQHTRTVEDTRNRCEKQKMCRTLYESTQQVMVCRNVDIEGC